MELATSIGTLIFVAIFFILSILGSNWVVGMITNNPSIISDDNRPFITKALKYARYAIVAIFSIMILALSINIIMNIFGNKEEGVVIEQVPEVPKVIVQEPTTYFDKDLFKDCMGITSDSGTKIDAGIIKACGGISEQTVSNSPVKKLSYTLSN